MPKTATHSATDIDTHHIQQRLEQTHQTLALLEALELDDNSLNKKMRSVNDSFEELFPLTVSQEKEGRQTFTLKDNQLGFCQLLDTPDKISDLDKNPLYFLLNHWFEFSTLLAYYGMVDHTEIKDKISVAFDKNRVNEKIQAQANLIISNTKKYWQTHEAAHQKILGKYLQSLEKKDGNKKTSTKESSVFNGLIAEALEKFLIRQEIEPEEPLTLSHQEKCRLATCRSKKNPKELTIKIFFEEAEAEEGEPPEKISDLLSEFQKLCQRFYFAAAPRSRTFRIEPKEGKKKPLFNFNDLLSKNFSEKLKKYDKAAFRCLTYYQGALSLFCEIARQKGHLSRDAASDPIAKIMEAVKQQNAAWDTKDLRVLGTPDEEIAKNKKALKAFFQKQSLATLIKIAQQPRFNIDLTAVLEENSAEKTGEASLSSAASAEVVVIPDPQPERELSVEMPVHRCRSGDGHRPTRNSPAKAGASKRKSPKPHSKPGKRVCRNGTNSPQSSW